MRIYSNTSFFLTVNEEVTIDAQHNDLGDYIRITDGSNTLNLHFPRDLPGESAKALADLRAALDAIERGQSKRPTPLYAVRDQATKLSLCARDNCHHAEASHVSHDVGPDGGGCLDCDCSWWLSKADYEPSRDNVGGPADAWSGGFADNH